MDIEETKDTKACQLDELTWRILGRGVNAEQINFAASLAIDILKEAKSEKTVLLKDGFVMFPGGNSFGFPPEEYLTKVSVIKKKAMTEKGISGFLSFSGEGAGVLDTYNEGEDIVMRLFFSLLSDTNRNLVVIDLSERRIGARFSLPEREDNFRWCAGKEQFLAAVKKYWFTRDQAARIDTSLLEVVW